MSRKGLVNLQKLTDSANSEVAGMLAELEGLAGAAGNLEAHRWSLRFIAEGDKSKGSTEV
jgi:hypothetical protein